MTSVIEQHQHLIEQLVPILQAPDFDELFKAITKDISKPHQFQLKMELNRLKKPCSRYIDLRGHVDGEVEPFEYEGKTHYMDSIAREVFEKESAHYGTYTEGVFEKVNNTENNFRVMHQKEQKERIEEKTRKEQQKKEQRKQRRQQTEVLTTEEEPEEQEAHPYQARRVKFQSYAVRSEERMNFSIAMEVSFGDGEGIKGTSSDVSVSGLKVKLPLDHNYQPGQLLDVKFRGLEEEFALGLSHGIQYEVIAGERIDNFQYIRMKRTYNVNTKSFDDFLNNFINGNKRRYKVNMENTEEAVIVKGYEQYYIPRTTTLPLYMAKIDGRLRATALLTTENNKPNFRYWLNDKQDFVLPLLFGVKRMKMLLNSPDRESILFSFTHSTGGKIHHYAAFLEELQNDDTLKYLFFGFGSAKKNWRVNKVQILDASFNHAHIPLSLPNSAGAEIKMLNRKPSPRVEGVVKNCFAIVALTDITELNEVKKYRAYAYSKKDVNKLKKFGIPRQLEPKPLEIVPVDYVNLRKESRFLYQTAISIELDEGQAVGATRDFSTRGMQIELTEPSTVAKGDIVLMNLPDMQKLTRKFKLTRLPYEVMAVSKNQLIVNVRVHEQGDSHPGRKFFQQLISSNRSKLTEAEENKSIPGLSPAMRNMYVHSCANTPFYIHRKGVRHMINVIGQGGRENMMHKLMAHFSEENVDFNLYPLIQGSLVDSIYGELLKNMRPQDAPKVRELFICINRSAKTPEAAINIEYGDDPRKEQSQKVFIDMAVRDHLFFAFRVHISRTGRPDIDYIGNELKYVGNYAIHRAKVLEDELWGIHGIGDAIDITDEMMLRYGYSDNDIDIQRQARQFFLNKTSVTG